MAFSLAVVLAMALGFSSGLQWWGTFYRVPSLLASVTFLYLPSLFSVQQIVKQIIPNFKEPITRAHIVNLQFYIWAICKTLQQAEDSIFSGSSLY